MRRTARLALGYFLLFMALVGGLLPILQGWIFFVAAVGVLGLDNPIIQLCLRQMARIKKVRVELEKRGWLKYEDYPPNGPPPA